MTETPRSSTKLPVLPVKATTGSSSFQKPVQRRETYKFNVLHLWQAFCRKWWQAILFGIVLAALIGPLIWLVVPLANPTVYTRVQFVERAAGNWQGHPDPPIHRQTQILLIKDPVILTAVLRRQDVAGLSVIKEQPEPEEWLMKELRVDFPSGPELMQFSMNGDRPQELKVIVSAVRDEYLSNYGSNTIKDRQNRLSTLIENDDKAKRSIKVLYEKFIESAEAGKEVNQETINLKHKINAELLEQTKKEIIRTQADLRQYRTDLRFMQENSTAKSNPSNKFVEDLINKHPTLQPLLIEYAETEELMRRTKEAAPSNPRVASLQKELDEIRKKIDARKVSLHPEIVAGIRSKSQTDQELYLETIKHRISQLEDSEKVLMEDANRLNKQSEKLNTATILVEEERQQIQVLESIRIRLATAIEQLRAEINTTPDRIRPINDVVVTFSEKYSNKIRLTIVGTIGALLAGIFLVAFWESRSRRITTSEEVLDHFGMNVVGTVPAPPKRMGLALSKADDDAWQNVLTESVDAFRTQLVFRARNHSHQVIMVSSADSGEGKTSLACHLALSLARSGQKTLLIDADLRNPTVNHLFEIPLEPGLSEVILGTKSANETIQRSTSPGLWILPAGRCSRRVVELLAQDTLKNLFGDLRNEFDFIIVDSSPILLVADPLLIAQQSDGVVFSIMHQVSKFTAIRDAVEKLTSLNVQTLGAVMNGTKPYQGYKNRKYAYRTMNEN